MSRGVFAILMTAAAFALASCAGGPGKLALPALESGLRVELSSWLDENGLPPEDYLASKFADHDIVFLGEYHRIRHDALLVQRMVPVLHRNGVYALGLEFLEASDQAEIDRLLAADEYDEKKANWLFWHAEMYWGFREYVDILRAAWIVNKGLPEGARTFRVVALNSSSDWSYVRTVSDRSDPDVMRKVWPEGNPDEIMARTILREIVAKGEKALIYSGINHAYTKFVQPSVDAQGRLIRAEASRMGNIVASELGDRACTIFLHSPWPPASGYEDPYIYPAGGIIDALFSSDDAPRRPVGFDVAGTPFGRIPIADSIWGLTAEGGVLEGYCDGWIFHAPFPEYEGVSVVPGWYSEENRAASLEQMPNPAAKHPGRSVKSLTEGMARDADMKRRFASFR